MISAHRRLAVTLFALAVAPAVGGAQRIEEDSGSITTIDARSGLVTVAAKGRATQRYHFVVGQAGLRTRLRLGQPVPLNRNTATGLLGGQTVRMQSVLTQVAVTPKVRAAMLCSTLQAAMNASSGDVPAGTPTALWTCVAEQVAGSNDYWCRCTPQFSF